MAVNYASEHPVNEVMASVINEVAPPPGFIYDKMMPEFDSNQLSGKLHIDNPRNYDGDPSVVAKRALGADRQSIADHATTTEVYQIDPYGLDSDRIPRELLENRNSQMGMLEERKALAVRRAVDVELEKATAAFYQAVATWANTTAVGLGALVGGTGIAFNQAGAAPLDDLLRLAKYQSERLGYWPDTLAVPSDTWIELALALNPRGFVGDASAGIAAGNLLLTDGELMRILQERLRIPNILVPGMQSETAAKGAASSRADIWTGSSLWMGKLQQDDAPMQLGNGDIQINNAAAIHLTQSRHIMDDIPEQGWLAGEFWKEGNVAKIVWAERYWGIVPVDVRHGFLLTACIT